MLNTAFAGGFATFGLNAGYRTRHWELRVDGSNLTDRRDPVAESELGDSQFYLLPARRIDGATAAVFLMSNRFIRNLLQMKSFPHEPLQPGFVEDVVGEFFVREHGEGGAFGPRRQF